MEFGVMSTTDDGTVSLKFQLTNELRGKLETVGKANGRSMAEEIRERLIGSFELEKDHKTLEILQDIVLLADEVKRDVGENWSANTQTREIFAAAVSDQIRNRDLMGDVNDHVCLDTAISQSLEATLGQSIARGFRRKVLQTIFTVTPYTLKSPRWTVR
jgi:hypothetical protein